MSEGVGSAIPKVEIEIENEGTFDLALTEEPFDGDGHIIEIAEAPARMGAGVMAWRPDQAESGLAVKG
jgi:hypothetical protein